MATQCGDLVTQETDRGGSDTNTRAALEAIAHLVHGVPDDVARALDGWVRQAWQVRDIGEEDRGEPLRALRGQLPPACPYCKTFSLRLVRGLRPGAVREPRVRRPPRDGRSAALTRTGSPDAPCWSGPMAGPSTVRRRRNHGYGFKCAVPLRVSSILPVDGVKLPRFIIYKGNLWNDITFVDSAFKPG